jgi:pimeloyl-ACP methyl ester carboxylesterase
MSPVVLVHGTWSGRWTDPETPFRYKLSRSGFRVVEPLFGWSGDISGIPSLTASQKHSDWKAGGASLADHLRYRLPRPLRRYVIAHSWGGAVAAYCAADHDVFIDRLITIATPPRKDLEPVWSRAKARVGYWLNVCDEKAPVIERLAQMFDGHWDWTPKVGQDQADTNITKPGIGHSRILSDPALMSEWDELLDAFRYTDAEVERATGRRAYV